MESLRTLLYQLKKTISTAFKFNHRKFEIEEIQKFIQKRADNFNGNQSLMIDSLLNRPCRKIVIDRVISNGDLLVEPQEIKMKSTNISRLALMVFIMKKGFLPTGCLDMLQLIKLTTNGTIHFLFHHLLKNG